MVINMWDGFLNLFFNFKIKTKFMLEYQLAICYDRYLLDLLWLSLYNICKSNHYSVYLKFR